MPHPQKTNEMLIKLMADLKKSAYKNDAPIWRDIAKRFEKPSRSWAEVNIRKLAAHTTKNDTVIVPGKVLGTGNMDVPITVAAYSFSDSARTKIRKAKGQCLPISALMEKNPKGKGIRIIG